jgi:hypothetical protein
MTVFVMDIHKDINMQEEKTDLQMLKEIEQRIHEGWRLLEDISWLIAKVSKEMVDVI